MFVASGLLLEMGQFLVQSVYLSFELLVVSGRGMGFGLNLSSELDVGVFDGGDFESKAIDFV
jgi:hypothetical protein